MPLFICTFSANDARLIFRLKIKIDGIIRKYIDIKNKEKIF